MITFTYIVFKHFSFTAHHAAGNAQGNAVRHVTCLLVPRKLLQLFFLLPDWLKMNHLKSRIECGFSDIFSRHICSTEAVTICVTNYAASFGAKNVQKTTFEAAEMMLGTWNQQCSRFFSCA